MWYSAGERWEEMTLQDYFLQNTQAKEHWAFDLNAGICPSDLSFASHRQVWWQCDRGHTWKAPPYSIRSGTSCPYCSGKRAIPGETDLKSVRPDLMGEWDTEKNSLDPGTVTVASHEKVWWRCKLGHGWQAGIFSRTTGRPSGCPYCAGKKVLAGFNDLATLRPKLAREWYAPLNKELGPEQVTLGSNKKVWWQCGDGHVWQAYVYARAKANGTGCPLCAGRKR